MMSLLTRRRDPHRTDCWLIYHGDVHIGIIARATGNPGALDQWQCIADFISAPIRAKSGTASSFNQGRFDFERAWHVFSAKRTEADYQAWRDQRDWTERKYARWKHGGRTQGMLR